MRCKEASWKEAQLDAQVKTYVCNETNERLIDDYGYIAEIAIEATKHMIIFDVLTNESPVGWKGERNRLYLSEAGYQKALDNQKAGNIKIISHANVARGNLYYDRRDMAR